MTDGAMPRGVAASRRLLLDALTQSGLAVRVAAPGELAAADAGPGDRVAVWPLALLAEPGSPIGALRVRVRYVVVAGPDDAGGPRLDLLDRVAGVVLRRDELVLVPEAVPADVWRAFGTPPQPAFLVDVPAVLVRDTDPPSPPRVQAPLRLRTVPMSAVDSAI